MDKTPIMHDIFTIAQTTHKRIRYCKSVSNGAESDHAAVEIESDITSIKLKQDAVIKGVNDWTNILTDEGYVALYFKTIQYIVDESTLYDDFND